MRMLLGRVCWLIAGFVVGCTPEAAVDPEFGAGAALIWKARDSAAGRVSVDSALVFFPGIYSELIAVRKATGQVAWRSATSGGLPRTIGFGTAISGPVVVMLDVNLYAFDVVEPATPSTSIDSGWVQMIVRATNPAAGPVRALLGDGHVTYSRWTGVGDVFIDGRTSTAEGLWAFRGLETRSYMFDAQFPAGTCRLNCGFALHGIPSYTLHVAP